MGLTTKTLSDFIDKHKGEKIIVVGCGVSARNILPYKDEFTIIGVNDIGRLFHPTYLLITDAPNRFHGKRYDIVHRSQAKFVFTPVKKWRLENPTKKVMFKLGKRGVATLDRKDTLDHFYTSPYCGLILAYKMGAKHIGMIGVDFTPHHFYQKDGNHELVRMNKIKNIDDVFGQLRVELENRGTHLYNLSEESQISTFPKITIDDFKNI